MQVLYQTKSIIRLLDKRPKQKAREGVAEAEVPFLGVVEVGVGGAAGEDPQCVQGVVRRPFQPKRPETPLPHLTIRELLPNGRQLPLKVFLFDYEGGYYVKVVLGYGVQHGCPGNPRRAMTERPKASTAKGRQGGICLL